MKNHLKSINRNLLGRRTSSFFDKSGRDWNVAWKENNTPWETGSISPGLKFAFEQGYCKSKVANFENALVPGCGSGLDVEYLHSLGFFKTVVGLDMSQVAIEVAKEKAKSKGNVGSQIEFVHGSYFDYDPPTKFDIVFDYLFFSAIDISMRPQWADSTSRLLKSKSGILITKIFPLFNSSSDTMDKLAVGPPYLVRIEDYKAVLEPRGLRLLHSESVPTSIKPRKGREMLAYWTKE